MPAIPYSWVTDMSRKLQNHTLQTLETVKARLNERYRATGRWETVASEFGVSVGTAVRVARGYEPKTAKVRTALNLPALVPAPACPSCGIVHVAKSCPVRRKVVPRLLFDWPLKALAKALKERR